MKARRLALVVGVLAMAAVGWPSPAAAQFDPTPWSCHPQKYGAYGRSSEHRRYTGLPFAGGGTAFYYVHYSASAIRCRGQTRIQYDVYMKTPGFPRSRYVIYQLQSAGKHKKYRAACVRLYDDEGNLTDDKRCLFKLEANKEIPIFGQRPLYQLRRSGVIRYVRMPHVAEQAEGGGRNLASVPQNIEIKLGPYRKRPKALW